MRTAPATTGRSSISKSILSAAALLVLPLPAAAHGFGQRFDLPLPLWLWLAGAGATLVITFVLLAVFAREPDFGSGYRRIILLHQAPRTVISFVRIFVVLAFLLASWAGLAGVQDPYRNISVVLIWVLWWVGFAFVCALVGDLW